MNKFFCKIILILVFFINNNAFSKEDVKVNQIFDGLNFPVHILKNESISNNSIFVLEHKPGQIIEIKNYANKPEKNLKPILNIDSLISENENWEQGLNGFAFSPNFKDDKLIFVSYNNKNNQIVISKFKYDNKINAAPISSEIKILTIDRLPPISEDKPEHNCGTIYFSPKDNYLYICVGDTRVAESAQNMNVLNGKILRINPFQNEDGKNYSIVKENPFISLGGKPEILFSGFRNPWKFSFDSETGDIYIPDVGSEYIEELNIIKYKDINNKALNFGAGCFEGSYRVYDKHYEDSINAEKICLKNIKDDSIQIIEPKLQYFHDSIIGTNKIYGNSITGGVVYKNKDSVWHNHYFFSDIVSSNIWYLDTNNKKNFIGVNVASGEDLGLTSVNQIDNKLLATSFMGSIYEIVLPLEKNFEKSIYDKPLIYSRLYGIDIMNNSGDVVFTVQSGAYRLLKKIRKYMNYFF